MVGFEQWQVGVHLNSDGLGSSLASFPGLPHFLLSIAEERRKRGTPAIIRHMIDVRLKHSGQARSSALNPPVSLNTTDLILKAAVITVRWFISSPLPRRASTVLTQRTTLR